MKKRSSGAFKVNGASIKGAAEAVLGTDKRGQTRIYDTRSGTLLTIVLLFLLGWIPMIGQMVSGFVGGRRAGSPTRGFTASLIGTFVVVLMLFLIVEILRAINSALITDPEGEIAAIASSSPVLQEMLDTALTYGRQLFGNADFTVDFATYMITIPFGVIGGIFADQAQKETRLIVARTGRVNARKARSMDAYKDGKALGFETFEQCTAMSVNSMAVPSRTTQVKQAPVTTTTPRRATIVRPRENPVSATVETTRVQSSPTSTTGTVRKKQESESESTVYI